MKGIWYARQDLINLIKFILFSFLFLVLLRIAVLVFILAAPARIELTYCGSKPHALTVGLWGRIYKASFFCSRLRIRTPDLIFFILCVSATPIWKRIAVEALMELKNQSFADLCLTHLAMLAYWVEIKESNLFL